MTILENVKTDLETDDSTAVRSHKSYDAQVAAICHHSGQYLTSEEANHPIWRRFITRVLYEQHDFPGLVGLDRAFYGAIHADEHQHISWSQIAVRNIALVVTLPLVALMVVALLRLQDYVSAFWLYIYLGVLALVLAACAGGLIFALFRYSRREKHFHNQAAGLPPAIADYPVKGDYEISVTETIEIDLDNVKDDRPEVLSQQGELRVKLYPDQEEWEDYATYQAQYEGLNVGRQVHGGLVALDTLNHTKFPEDTLEFDHRIVLRMSSAELGLRPDSTHVPPLEKVNNYTVLEQALYPSHNGLKRFPLEIEPRLVPDNSRMLQLRFYWRGPDHTAPCRLEECILDIPDVLGKVLRVSYGRYDHERQQVIWRNRSFRQQELILSITFENPILKCHEVIKGSYSFSHEGLISGMELSSERVWTSVGTVAPSRAVTITKRTAVVGRLMLGLQQLSQEHELVKEMLPLDFQLPPDENMVEAVTEVLLEEGFDLQRIMRTAPRLDPTGRLDKQLFYWDIVGRKYDEELLDSLDVHVVVTGSDRIISTVTDDEFKPQSYIDLRVRCLHDPRNLDTKTAVENLIGGDDEQSLRAKIENRVEANNHKTY